jgi:hypothetical protein
MKSITKIILFSIVFSLAYWLIRTIDHGKIIRVDIQDLGGIPWLYSAICLIFSILAAFTIQKEWEHWNELTEDIKGEANALRELWLWSRYYSKDAEEKVTGYLGDYLTLIQEEWSIIEQGKSSEEVEKILDSLRNTLVGLMEKTHRLPLLPLFNDLIRNRNRRIYQSGNHIPYILKNTLIFADVLLIILSLFIGVRNPWIDYIFTVGIGLLAYTIYIVIDDLDNPFRPGAWHLTPKEYQTLLDNIKNTYKREDVVTK